MSLKKLTSLKFLHLKKLILNKKQLIFIVMIVFAASIFRFAGVWDGLPYTNYHTDEGIVLYEGLKQIDSGIGLTDNLTYPAFSKYTFAFLISPYIIQLIGKEEIARLGEKKLRDNENLYKILKMGRIIFVFFGIFLLLVCFKISNIFEERKAVAFLLYLGFCPAFVIAGWYLLPGMERLLFEYLAILSLFLFIKDKKRKYLIYFAILTGIAMSCNYSSYYLYVFFPYLYFKYLRGKIGFLILLLLIPVTTFFLTTPEALFHFGRFVDTLGYQNNIYLSGLNKITWLQGIPQYFIGWPLLIAGLIGFILSLWKKKSSFVQVLAIYFLFRLFISLVLQSSHRIYYRNEIELALILLIFASFFTSQISSAIEKILKKRRINFQASYAYYSMIVLLTISPFLKTVGVAKMVYSQKETRIQAGEYINKIQKECPSCNILVSKELEILPRYLNDKIVLVPQEDIPVLSKRQLFDYVVTPTYLDGGREKVYLEEMGNVNFLIDRMSRDWKYRDFMSKVLGVYQGKKNGSLRPADISLKPLWSRYDVNPTIAVIKKEVILAESVEKEKVIRMEGAAFIEESFDSIKREIKRTVAQKGLPSIEETLMLPKMGFPAGEYEVEITAKKESPKISDDFSSKMVIEMKSENGEVLKSNEFELDDSFHLYRTGIFRADSYESISISISKKTYGAGRSLYLNGKDKNFVIIPDSPTLNSNEITLEAWVFLIEPIEIGGMLQAPLVSKNGINGYYLRLLHNDHSPNISLAGEWELANGGEFSRIPLKRWVHIAATADGRRARVFVNGYDVSHPFHSKNGGHYKGRINSYGYPLIIGSNSIDGEGCYIGVIDEVRIWNRSLSDEEIKRNIIWDLVTPKKGLIAYYKFEGDDSNIIKDHSGNNNNGKLKKTGSDSLNFIHTVETLEMKNSDIGWLKMVRIKKLTKPSEEKFYYNQKKDDLYIKKE